MIKEDIITQIAADTMTRKVLVEEVINSFLDNIEKAMVNGDNVIIRGFGTFQTKERKAKVGRNIKAGIPVRIPAHIEPVFKPSEALKKKVYREV